MLIDLDEYVDVKAPKKNLSTVLRDFERIGARIGDEFWSFCFLLRIRLHVDGKLGGS